MEMDERKIKILQAIIGDYITTGDPVGSRTIAKKYNLGISSATIRNEMADLEEMGYIEQLHTSSGRKPSDKGYRLYVDKLMNITDLSPKEEFLIKNRMLDVAIYELDKVLKEMTILLSQLTNLACVVKAPSVNKSHIKMIQLLKMDSYNTLLIIVTDNGVIKNNVIKVKKSVTSDNLNKLSKILTFKLENKSVEEIDLYVINEIKKDLAGYEDVFNAIIPALYESLKEADNSEIYSAGITNILEYPEYNNIQKAKEFLTLINDKEKLKGLLNNNKNISISIGTENKLEDAKNCSVVSAVYKLGNVPLGSIAVIGPTRMPYSKVVSILSKMVNEVNSSLIDVYDKTKK